jgi:hypothetical protein
MLVEDHLEGLVQEAADELVFWKDHALDPLADMETAVQKAGFALPDTESVSEAEARAIDVLDDKISRIVGRLACLRDHVESEIEGCEQALEELADSISDVVIEAAEEVADEDAEEDHETDDE